MRSKIKELTTSQQELAYATWSNSPFIWVLTHEEERFIEEYNTIVLPSIKEKCSKESLVWSATQGLTTYEEYSNLESLLNAAAGREVKNLKFKDLISTIVTQCPEEEKTSQVYILRDLNYQFTDGVLRKLRDLYLFFQQTSKTLIFLSPSLDFGPSGGKQGVPNQLDKYVQVIDYELPTATFIESKLNSVIEDLVKKKGSAISHDETKLLVKSLQGLSSSEITRAMTSSLVTHGRFVSDHLLKEKRQIIKKSNVLEYLDSNISFNDVGGLDLIKGYLDKYTNAYTEEAKEFGVEPLRGVILTGIAGCGKSLIAKSLGNMWGLPVLRLDIGRVMGSLVGQSEAGMRNVIKTLESVAPAICFLDEIEKGLSGTGGSGKSDSGTTDRVFGTLLTAMQEGLKDITIIATANDISKLPPELIRRFNEVFFVDIPGPTERWDIFTIHLAKRGRDSEASEFKNYRSKILKASEGFTGAECEKAIKDSISSAFHIGAKKLTAQHLIKTLKETKPLSHIMSKEITSLRKEAHKKYRFASSWAAKQKVANTISTSSGKKINLDDSLDELSELTKTSKKNTKSLLEPKDISNMI